ncbi:hypothetical protein Y032_0004g1935 [Ancylostoma ceylanicum]|nr:hypothetical protein Y032_0004g1935 [Ancylostoma ceylanicum]
MIEKVQNSFTRKLMIRIGGFDYNTIPNGHYRDIKFNLETLTARRRKNDLLMVWKILNQSIGLNAESFFVLAHSRTRGGSAKLRLKKARYSIRFNYFANRAGSDFLKLSKKYFTGVSLHSFKTTVDRYL